MADERDDIFGDDDEQEESGKSSEADRAELLQKILKYAIIAGIVIAGLLIQWMIAEIVHYVNFGDIIKKEKEKYQAISTKMSFPLGKTQFSLMTPNSYIHFGDIILAIDTEYDYLKDDLGFQKAKIMHIIQKVISSKTYDEIKTEELRRKKLKTELLTKLNNSLGFEEPIIVDIYMPGVRVFKSPK